METTTFDTYGTAAPGFAHGVIALGNDAGILSVGFQSDSVPSQEVTETDVVGLLHPCPAKLASRWSTTLHAYVASPYDIGA